MWDCATPAKWNDRWMWPSATPATQSAAASSATKTGPSAPPSAMSATPATQNEGGCEPRLPRKVVDQHGVWKMVVDKDVCERWCVKDGGWQRWLTKMVCERWCVRDGVWKMVVDKDGGQRWCVKDGRRDAGGRRPGLQNQKQEPHAKLWGTKNSLRAVRIACLGDHLGAWHRKFALHWCVQEFHSVSFGWMILPIWARALSKATDLQGWTTRRTHTHLGLGSALTH